MTEWGPFEAGDTIGREGSEGGKTLRDEEHPQGARITLERDGAIAPYAITCGIYGWMVHTCFFSGEDEADGAYDAMRSGLGDILSQIPLAADPDAEARSQEVIAAIHRFTERFP